MKRIFKYQIHVGSTLHLNIGPEDEILHFAQQGGDPSIATLWAEVTQSDAPYERQFVILPTGAELPDCYAHRGTALFMGGSLVWHLYEVRG